MRPAALPKKLPIDLTTVETSKGSWGIFVDHVVETHEGRNVLVRLILEQMIDDERVRMRKVEVIVNTLDAHDPDLVDGIARRIRTWIESTEGDGFINITEQSN
jgi:hypothetical protein